MEAHSLSAPGNDERSAATDITLFIGDPDAYSRQADVVVAMSQQTWAKIYLSAADMQELIANGEVEMTAGDATQAAGLIELFDRYNPCKALVLSPASLA